MDVLQKYSFYLSYSLNIAAGIYGQVSGVGMFRRQPANPHENVPRQIRVVTTPGQVPRGWYYLKLQNRMITEDTIVLGGKLFRMLLFISGITRLR